MYPELDEAIYNALKSSSEPALQPFKIRLPGSKQLDPNIRSIMIGNTGNKLETPGEDFDDRRIGYGLLVTIKKVDYLAAMKQLRSVTSAVVKTLRKNLDENYTAFMQIDDILPDYEDDYTIKRAEIQISFLVEEYYSEDPEEINDIQIRGGLE